MRLRDLFTSKSTQPIKASIEEYSSTEYDSSIEERPTLAERSRRRRVPRRRYSSSDSVTYVRRNRSPSPLVKDKPSVHTTSTGLQKELDKAPRSKPAEKQQMDAKVEKNDQQNLGLHKHCERMIEALHAQLEQKGLIVSQLQKDIETMKAQHRVEMHQVKSRSTQKHVKVFGQLNAHYAGKEAQLQKEVDAYSAQLMARENHAGLRDEEISTLFTDLVQDVEELARLEWRSDSIKGPSGSLGSRSQLPRQLKKEILQDSIWQTLHQYIFCSPFRIFGVEGRKLEKQWNKQCGQDPRFQNEHFTWPSPGSETERWRYVNAAEGLASLAGPVPSEFDPRLKLRKASILWLSMLEVELGSMLSRVALSGETNIPSLKRMLDKAVTIWLKFGSQRYRVMIERNGSGIKSIADKLSWNREVQGAYLQLGVIPALRRHGNSKGYDLDQSFLIEGCAGLTTTVI